MWKRIVLSIAFVAACKTDDAPAPAPTPAAPAPAPAAPAARPGPRPQLDTPPPTGGDTDRRPPIDRAEMRERRAEKMRERLDTNGDGKITGDELKNATGRMKFDDPAAIDTDHDGIISDDELAAAMKARREQWRQQRADEKGDQGVK